MGNRAIISGTVPFTLCASIHVHAIQSSSRLLSVGSLCVTSQRSETDIYICEWLQKCVRTGKTTGWFGTCRMKAATVRVWFANQRRITLFVALTSAGLRIIWSAYKALYEPNTCTAGKMRDGCYSVNSSLSPPYTARNAASSKSSSFGIATAISWYQMEALENVSKITSKHTFMTWL